MGDNSSIKQFVVCMISYVTKVLNLAIIPPRARKAEYDRITPPTAVGVGGVILEGGGGGGGDDNGVGSGESFGHNSIFSKM